MTLGLPVTTWPGSPQGAGGIVLSSEMNASSIGSKSWPLEVHAAVTTPIYRCVKKQIGWPSSKWSTPTRYCADRRDAASQMALFTEDTDFLVYLETRNPVPTQHLRRRHALPPVFDELKYLRSYHALQRSKHHSAGWRQRFWVDLLPGTPWQGRRVGADPDGRRNPLPRHFVKRDGGWLFSQRKFMVDWTETRSLVTG